MIVTRKRLLVPALVAALAIVGVVWLVVGGEERRAESASGALEYEDCREDNLPGAYIRLVLAQSPGFDPAELGLPAPDDVLPLLACAATVEAGRPVRLSGRQERRYLRVVRRSCLPIVERGIVVDAQALPGRSDNRRCHRLNVGAF